jgi:hypothetical protein
VDKRKETFNAEDYVTMMKHIREIAEEKQYSTAEIGYALFAWDNKVREGNLH